MQVALAVVLAASSTVVFALESLSFGDAQRIAIERSRQLAAYDAAITSSREMAVAATQMPDPVLRAGVDNLPVDSAERFSLTRDFMTMRRIGLTQEFTRSEKRGLRRERWDREADKSVAEKGASTAVIQRDTAVAWLDRYYAQALAGAADAQVRIAQDEVAAAEGAYRAGRGTQADVFAARGALGLARDKRTEVERRERVARIELDRWVGREAAGPLGEPPDMDEVPFLSGSLEEHLGRHPEIVALSHQVEIAEAEARLADAGKRPDWTWELAYQQRGPAYSNMVSIGVSVPLPWDPANRQDREVASKLALVEQARANRDEMLRAHVADVAAMIEQWKLGRRRQEGYRDEILPSAQERTVAVVAAYRGGKSTLAEVLAARRADFESRMQAIELDIEVARLWARITYLLPDLAVSQRHTARNEGMKR